MHDIVSCIFIPQLFIDLICTGSHELSQAGDKLTFDLGPDVPGIVLDTEERA